MRDHSRPPEQVRWIPQFVEPSASAI